MATAGPETVSRITSNAPRKTLAGAASDRDFCRPAPKAPLSARAGTARRLDATRVWQTQRLYGNRAAQKLVNAINPPSSAFGSRADPSAIELRTPSLDFAQAALTTPNPALGESSAGFTTGLVDDSVMIGSPAAAAKTSAPASIGRAAGQPGSQLHTLVDAQRNLIVADSQRSEALVARGVANRRQQIGAQFGGVRQSILAAFSQSSTAVRNFVVERQAQVQATSKSIVGSVKELIEGTIKTAEGAATGAQQGLTAFVDNVTGSLSQSVQGIAKQITGVISTIPAPNLPGVAQFRAAATRFVGQAAGAVTSGLSQVQNFVRSALQQGMQLLTSLLTGVTQLANSALTNVASGIQKGVQALFGFLGRIATQILSVLRSAVQSTLVPAVTSIESKTLSGLLTSQQQAITAIRKNRDDHLQALAGALNANHAGPGAASSAGGAGNEDPEAAINAIGAEAVQNDHAIVSTFEDRTSSVLGSIFQAITGGASRVVQAMVHIVADARQAVVAKVEQVLEAMSQVTGAAKTVMQSVLQSLGENLVAVVQSVRSLVQSSVDRLLNFGRNALSRIGQLIGRFVTNLLSGKFSLPSLSEVIGVFEPAASNGPITPRPPGTITRPALQFLFLILVAAGALIAYAFPALTAGIITALIAAGLSPAGALAVLGILAILAAIALFLLLLLLFKLLNKKKPKPKPKPAEPKITHETVFSARDGSANTRTDIGVGEHVNFTGSVSGTWTASAGSPRTGVGTTFAWVAPERVQTTTIQLTASGKTASVSMKIVEPDNITATKEREIPIPAGTQGAGMILNFNFHPFNVSFGNAGTREVAGPASNIQGYYLKHGMPHNHNPGPVRFFPISEDNKFSGTVRDRASQQGYPQPWDVGSFHWEIPNKFKVNTEGGDGKKYTTVIQEFKMAGPSGKTKVTKAGAEVERTP